MSLTAAAVPGGRRPQELMIERRTWRPPLYLWILLCLGAIAFLHEFEGRRLHGEGKLILPVAIVIGVGILRELWERPPAVMMCVALALSIFSGAWRQMGLGGLPLDRAFLVAVPLAYLLRAPGTAHVPPLRLRDLHLLQGLVIAYVAVSAIVAGTLTEEIGLLSLTDEVGLFPYLVFLLAPSIFATERARGLLLATLVGIGLYLGITAVFESLGPHAFVFPHYIVMEDEILPGHRAGGPFQSSVSEGFSTFTCAIAASIALGRWRRRSSRTLAAIAIPLCIFACFLTLERGVWIASASAIVVTSLMSRAGRRRLVPGLCCLGIFLGGALVLSPALHEKTTARVNEDRSVWDRVNQTSAAIRMIEAKPVFGFGWRTFESDGLDYYREAPLYPMTGFSNYEKQIPLHDTYLAYTVELGIVGAALWLITFVIGMGTAVLTHGPPALRPWKLGLMAMSICYLIVCIFDPYQSPFPNLILWLWAGLALSETPETVRERLRRRRVSAPRLALEGT